MADTIPIIDISGYMSDSPGGLDAAADQVRDALTSVGFFVLTGHGVPRAQIDETFAAAARAARAADGEEARPQDERA